MSKKELLHFKIEMTCLAYSTNAILFIKGKMSKEQLDIRQANILNELYEYIAGLEPKHESEVI